MFVVSVDLRLGYCKRPYIVTMEMHMMAVLMPFNYADTMTFSDLREFTQLPDKDLIKQLQMLVDSRILHTQVSPGSHSYASDTQSRNLYKKLVQVSGFKHPGNTQKSPSGFSGENPMKKKQQKTHTKLNSISVCRASNS